MDFDEFIEQTKNALNANECIVFFAQCSVKYSGRAEAELGVGDRIIMIKSDNTLLIHQPKGSAPVNYMKDGSKIDVEKKSHHAVIKSMNSKFKDYLEIDVFRIHSFANHLLDDGEKLLLAGTERDMSDMIYDNPTLISPDFKPLSREEHTKYGFIDVFGYNEKNELVIVECKRYVAGLDAVTQLRRYVEKMKSLKGISNVKGLVAAPAITDNALKMLTDWGFNFVVVNPPKKLERYEKDQKKLFDY